MNDGSLDAAFEDARRAFEEGSAMREQVGASIFDDGSPSQPRFDRIEVETKIAKVQQRIAALEQRGIAIDGGELIMQRILKLLEIVVGDMDDQRRLQFEDELFDLYVTRLDATEPAVNQAMLARGVSPGGLFLPPNGHGGRAL